MINNTDKINLQTDATSFTWQKYIIQTHGPPMDNENTTSQTTGTLQPPPQEVAHKLAKNCRKRGMKRRRDPAHVSAHVLSFCFHMANLSVLESVPTTLLFD